MKAITANRLIDGKVVYARPDASWTPELTEAAVYTDDKEAGHGLDTALRDILTVVGPYLIEVEDGEPFGRARVRETIRKTGPSAGTTRRFAE